MDISKRNKVANWIDVAEMHRNPYPTYERLRKEGPVMWSPILNRNLATSYEACAAIEDDLENEHFTAWEPEEKSLLVRAVHGRPMNRKDDPEHKEQRDVEIRSLKPNAIKKAWLKIFQENTDRFLDKYIEAGPGADFMEIFAGPYASDNLRQVLGFRNATHKDVWRWSKDFCDGIGNVTDDPEIWERCRRSSEEIEDAYQELEPYYQKNPDSSVLSGFIHSDVEPEIFLPTVMMTISGGANEPKNVVATAIYQLLTNPDQKKRLDAGEADYLTTFEETVRWLSPLSLTSRNVVHDMDFFGAKIYAGDTISVMIGSANRDESMFDRADEFDIFRDRRPHYGFGRGDHICAGMWIARYSVGHVALPTIFERLNGIKIADKRNPYIGGFAFRGIYDLGFDWDKAVRSTEA